MVDDDKTVASDQPDVRREPELTITGAGTIAEDHQGVKVRE